MKKTLAGVIIALVGCVFIPSWVDAQQRDRGQRGRGIAEQRRGYRGRQQRRRYYRGKYEWYDDAGTAVGTAIGGWLSRQFKSEPSEPVRDIAWCIGRYKSYNPKTGQYLGNDGKYHDCP